MVESVLGYGSDERGQKKNNDYRNGLPRKKCPSVEIKIHNKSRNTKENGSNRNSYTKNREKGVKIVRTPTQNRQTWSPRQLFI